MQPEDEAALSELLFELVPTDGSSIGNVTLLPKFRDAAKKKLKIEASDEDYWTVRNSLIVKGTLDKGRGRGGSVYRLVDRQPQPKRKVGKNRPWILYEAGVAKGKLNTPVYGIAFGIPLSRANTGPFAQFQNCGDDEESLTKLVIQLVQRIPDSEPDREAIQMQVKMFMDRVDAILQKTADPDAPPDETALDDSSVARPFEEVKVMFQDLPSRLGDKIDEHVGSRRRRRKHRLHPMMIEDLAHMVGGPRSRGDVGLLVLASLFREDCPWLYELGVDAYRAVRSGNTHAAEQALQTFERSVEFTLHGPMMEMFRSSKEDHMIMRDLGHIAEEVLPRIIRRALPAVADKESKASD
jgi:hypothetical protein